MKHLHSTSVALAILLAIMVLATTSSVEGSSHALIGALPQLLGMASTSVGGAHQHAVGERQSPYSTTPIITTNAKCPTTYTKSYWAINGSLSYLLGSWSSIGSFSVVNKTMGVIMQMLKVNNTCTITTTPAQVVSTGLTTSSLSVTSHPAQLTTLTTTSREPVSPAPTRLRLGALSAT